MLLHSALSATQGLKRLLTPRRRPGLCCQSHWLMSTGHIGHLWAQRIQITKITRHMFSYDLWSKIIQLFGGKSSFFFPINNLLRLNFSIDPLQRTNNHSTGAVEDSIRNVHVHLSLCHWSRLCVFMKRNFWSFWVVRCASKDKRTLLTGHEGANLNLQRGTFTQRCWSSALGNYTIYLVILII